MKLTAADLREIADTVDKIKDIKLKVEVVEVRGHKVVLERKEMGRNGMDGMEYFVKGVTSSELSGRG